MKIASLPGELLVLYDGDCDASNPFSASKMPPYKYQQDVASVAKTDATGPSPPVDEIPV